MDRDSPLVLGGHTFIEQLGNDPPTSPEQQLAIVATCLDQGITWIDTTYQPERVALGRILEQLGRRAEARIVAWNFFTEFASGEPVGVSRAYQPSDIDRILEQLCTSYVDCLVVHAQEDVEANHRQVDLAVEWRRQGYARRLGLWTPSAAAMEAYRAWNPYDCVFCAANFAIPAGPLEAYRSLGWEVFATSPFHRGWELDRMAAHGASRGQDSEALRTRLADHMIRYALFHPHVNRLVVAMRKPEWIARNLESVHRGPLSTEERAWLLALRPPKPVSWRRRLLGWLAPRTG